MFQYDTDKNTREGLCQYYIDLHNAELLAQKATAMFIPIYLGETDVFKSFPTIRLMVPIQEEGGMGWI